MTCTVGDTRTQNQWSIIGWIHGQIWQSVANDTSSFQHLSNITIGVALVQCTKGYLLCFNLTQHGMVASWLEVKTRFDEFIISEILTSSW